jgi:hypothetical protein
MLRVRILVILAFMMSAAFTFAQETVSGDVKIKSKFDRVTSVDKSKPVRRALEQQYKKIRQAQLAKKPEGVLDLRTPDFEVHMPSGEVWDFEASKQYMLRGFEQVQTNLEMRFILGEIDVSGNSAAVQIEQHWSRMQFKKGQLRRVDTSAMQRETWTRTPNGWCLRLIDNIRPGAWYIDGKRVDPLKPYDPDAPPFTPPSR